MFKRIVICQELVELTEDTLSAMILRQFIYWSCRVNDFDEYLQEIINHKEYFFGDDKEKDESLLQYGWIFKKTEKLREELMVKDSICTIRRRIKKLIDNGWIAERQNIYNRWDQTKQFWVNHHKIEQDLRTLGYSLQTVMGADYGHIKTMIDEFFGDETRSERESKVGSIRQLEAKQSTKQDSTPHSSKLEDKSTSQQPQQTTTPHRKDSTNAPTIHDRDNTTHDQPTNLLTTSNSADSTHIALAERTDLFTDEDIANGLHLDYERERRKTQQSQQPSQNPDPNFETRRAEVLERRRMERLGQTLEQYAPTSEPVKETQSKQSPRKSSQQSPQQSPHNPSEASKPIKQENQAEDKEEEKVERIIPIWKQPLAEEEKLTFLQQVVYWKCATDKDMSESRAQCIAQAIINRFDKGEQTTRDESIMLKFRQGHLERYLTYFELTPEEIKKKEAEERIARILNEQEEENNY